MNRRESILALAAASIVTARPSVAQTTTASPKSPNRQAIVQQNVRELLLAMDTDKNGKISKQEWMDFMSKEFDRLDTDHSGELNPKELEQSRFTIHRVSPAIQGK
jgi:Ca2+-binding EF-hand superfamily protein